MKTVQRLILALALVLGYLILPKVAFASNLHLSPAGGNISLGQTLAVQVRLNTAGASVNAVTAVLNYSADKLDVAYITPGSAFSIEAEKSVGGGAIRISQGNINGVSGDVAVATIGFRGKALGKATVNFLPGSAAPNAVDSSDSLNLGASSGGSFTIVQAAADTSSQSSSANGPIISNIQISNIASNSATIAWKTDRKSDSEIFYGVDQNQFVLSSIKSDLITDHTVTLQNLQFPPGTKFYFQIKAKDVGNLISNSGINSIQLHGYKVVIKLTDKNGKPLSNIKVTIYSDPNESITNDQGQVIFADMPPGKHTILIQNGSLEKSQDILVADNGNLVQQQEYQIQFNPDNSTTPRSGFNINSKNTLAMIVLAISILALIGILVYIFKRRQGGGGSSSSGGESNPFPLFENNTSTNSNPVVFHPGQP